MDGFHGLLSYESTGTLLERKTSLRHVTCITFMYLLVCVPDLICSTLWDLIRMNGRLVVSFVYST